MSILSVTNISISEVETALGESTTKLSELCKSDKINKWSFWKPTKSSVDTLTEDAIGAANASLYPTTLSLTGVNVYGGINGTSTSGSASPTASEWTYLKVTKYRLGDFRTYDHDSVPCDGSYSNKEFLLGSYDTNTGGANYWPGDGYTYAWHPTEGSVGQTACLGGLLQCFAFRFSSHAADMVGDLGGNSIPFNKLFDTTSNSDIYRLGLMIKVGNKWYMCVSAYGLGHGRDGYGGDMIPTLGTNTYLASLVQSAVTTSATFSAFPCLVKNAVISFAAYNQGTKFYSEVRNWGAAWCMPSGQGVFNITFKMSSKPVEEDETLKANIPSGYNWLCNLAAHQSIASKLVASGQQYSTYALFYFQDTALTSSKSFSIVKYNKNGSSASQSATLAAGAKIVVDGTTYYGGDVLGGLEQPSFSQTYSKLTINSIVVPF